MFAIVTPAAYAGAVSLAAVVGVAAVVAARRRGGGWTAPAARVLGALLLADAGSYVAARAISGAFSAKTDLPLALCNVAVLVAAAACFWRVPLLVELTWFWGLAGTLQAIVTPDLSVGFPHLVFFQYMVGHLGIVLAALFLVVGMGLHPRAWAAPRVLVMTALYTAVVGAVDGWAGANYMFLRQPPGRWTLLSVLGPWPWYTFSAAGVAAVLVTALDMPFWRERRRLRSGTPSSGTPSSDMPSSDMPSSGLWPGVPARPAL